jgi:hypothetical protein
MVHAELEAQGACVEPTDASWTHWTRRVVDLIRLAFQIGQTDSSLSTDTNNSLKLASFSLSSLLGALVPAPSGALVEAHRYLLTLPTTGVSLIPELLRLLESALPKAVLPIFVHRLFKDFVFRYLEVTKSLQASHVHKLCFEFLHVALSLPTDLSNGCIKLLRTSKRWSDTFYASLTQFTNQFAFDPSVGLDTPHAKFVLQLLRHQMADIPVSQLFLDAPDQPNDYYGQLMWLAAAQECLLRWDAKPELVDHSARLLNDEGDLFVLPLRMLFLQNLFARLGDDAFFDFVLGFSFAPRFPWIAGVCFKLILILNTDVKHLQLFVANNSWDFENLGKR